LLHILFVRIGTLPANASREMLLKSMSVIVPAAVASRREQVLGIGRGPI
jgi:hypothetical protein